MNQEAGDKWKETAVTVIRSSRTWLWLPLLVAITLFLVEPAPPKYLIGMAILGLSYAGLLVLAWLRRSMVFYLLFVMYLSGSSTLLERMFRIESQYQDVQGIFLAFAFSGILLGVFRDRLIRRFNKTP
jgi:hypothetical protein